MEICMHKCVLIHPASTPCAVRLLVPVTTNRVQALEGEEKALARTGEMERLLRQHLDASSEVRDHSLLCPGYGL